MPLFLVSVSLNNRTHAFICAYKKKCHVIINWAGCDMRHPSTLATHITQKGRDIAV